MPSTHWIHPVFAFALSACAAAASVSPVAAPGPRPGGSPASAGSPGLPDATEAADHAISRAALRAVVARGLGAFLQRVDLDDRPVLSGGKFHGFRIVALRDPAFWRGVDLRPGDVVTGVNGKPIERPEQAVAVFDSLELAGELRVDYERDGQPRTMVYPIVDAGPSPSGR